MFSKCQSCTTVTASRRMPCRGRYLQYVDTVTFALNIFSLTKEHVYLPILNPSDKAPTKLLHISIKMFPSLVNCTILCLKSPMDSFLIFAFRACLKLFHIDFPIDSFKISDFSQNKMFLYPNRKLELGNQRNQEKTVADVARNWLLNERTLRYTYSMFLRDCNVIQNSQVGPKYIQVEVKHKLRIGQYIEDNPIITIVQSSPNYKRISI
ncbi:hypothetical protein RF11_03603 [Thelohanellus kitauei]|uniref:Uncharacterized protein n=1 Tax=Thelohanellus kitauei TaxID=669202 RepID=A0A0C2JUN8_THEKT|nr:hypothetical protein RF11_03603 [Thelohanellus kitauei]